MRPNHPSLLVHTRRGISGFQAPRAARLELFARTIDKIAKMLVERFGTRVVPIPYDQSSEVGKNFTRKCLDTLEMTSELVWK